MGPDGPTAGNQERESPPHVVATFGARLRGWRVRAGLSQEALAERAGLGVATLKALERDQRQRPHPHTMAQLADALGLSPTERDAPLDGVTAGARAEGSDGARGQSQAGPSRYPAVHTPRLPAWLTSFVGREDEVEAVRCQLDPTGTAVRLLTLVGPGGVGKTRLAVSAAAALTVQFPDGVTFVDLAPVSDPRLVSAAIARSLGLRESSRGSTRDLLVDHLGASQMLLVLDTLEHLVAAGPELAELLNRCAGLALLATSRTALRLRAERLLRIAPLATPAAEHTSVEQVMASPAARLFVERVQAAAPGFELDRTNAAAVAEVCRRLDGMPLAIELAAARAGVLPPAALLQRLTRRLPLLTRGAADLPERQQTLRQTLAWSHALLGPAERALFRRLAVFAGGCALDAAEAVGRADFATSDEMLDALGVLVDNSLVSKSVGPDGQPRFGMLGTVREYAQECLIESGEVEATRRSHVNFYLALAERTAPEFGSDNHAVWFSRMEYDHANVRAALDWLIEANDLNGALRLAAAVTLFWLRRGYFTDAQRVMRLLTATTGQPGAMRAAARRAAARLATITGDWTAQAEYAAESIRLYRELGDTDGTAGAMTELGVACWEHGQLDQAQVHLEESLRLYQTLDDSVGIAAALLTLGCVARDRGDLDAARPLLTEALTRFQTADEQISLAHVLNNLGWLELDAGHLEEARELAEASLARRGALGLAQAAGVSQTLLGKIALANSQPEVARDRFKESLSAHRGFGYTWGIAHALEGVAGLVARPQPARALRLAACAHALRSAISRPVPPAERPLLASWLEPAKRALSAESARQAQIAGAALSEEQAVAEALELTAPP